MIRGQEWIVVLVVVLLVFGARKLPELARSLGASAKEFRKGIEEGSKGDGETTANATEDEPSKPDRQEAPPPDSS